MRIYISGNTNMPPGQLKEQYQVAAAELRKRNHEPFNPFDLQNDGQLPPWPQRLEYLSLECTGIYLIEGWQTSEQASTERYMCLITGKKVYYQASEREKYALDEVKVAAIERIKEAIHEASDMTIEQYRTHSRKEEHVFARMIFSHHGKRAGLSPDEISGCLCISRSMVYHYFKRYGDEYKYTPGFRCMAQKVDKFFMNK